MLFGEGNPYQKPLPETLELSWEDFVCGLSGPNAYALQRPAEWCVLSYAGADLDDLPGFLFDNLLQLKSVGSSPDVHVCAFFEGPLVTDTFFARLEAGTPLSGDILLRWAKRHADEPKTLRDALQLAHFFPAAKRAVFVSGHGRGWRGLLQDLDVAGRRYISTGRLKLPGPNAECAQRLRACQGEVQERFNATLGTAPAGPVARYDLMALDACEMGNLETLVTLAEFADIMVVSQNLMPPEGYPYETVIANLRDRPGQSAAEFATYLVGETKRYYGMTQPRRRITQIAIAREGLLAFMDELATLTVAIGPMEEEAGFKAVTTALEHAQYYTGTGSIDLKGFLLEIAGTHPDGAVKAAAAATLRCWDAMVIAASTLEGADTHGLAVYGPAPDDFSREYLEVTSRLPLRIWAWTKFLAAYALRHLGPESPKSATLRAVLDIPEGTPLSFE